MPRRLGLRRQPVSLTPPAREATAPTRGRSKNRTPRSRLVGRATYDIGRELKEVIRRESIDLGVPASQLARYLLLYAWDMYINEQIPVPPQPAADRARELAVRVAARLNIERRKRGEAGIDTKTIHRLQQLLREELEKAGAKGENTPKP